MSDTTPVIEDQVLKVDNNRVVFQYNVLAFFYQIFTHVLMYFTSVGNFATAILVYIPFFVLTGWNLITIVGSNSIKRMTHDRIWVLNVAVADTFFYIAVTSYIAFTESD